MSDNSKMWELWAYDRGEDRKPRFTQMGRRRYVELHGLPFPIVPVQVREDEAGTYYGWLATDSDTPAMIWGSHHQFSMCFPYGVEAEVARGKGVVLRLTVTKQTKPAWEQLCGCVSIRGSVSSCRPKETAYGYSQRREQTLRAAYEEGAQWDYESDCALCVEGIRKPT